MDASDVAPSPAPGPCKVWNGCSKDPPDHCYKLIFTEAAARPVGGAERTTAYRTRSAVLGTEQVLFIFIKHILGLGSPTKDCSRLKRTAVRGNVEEQW